MYIQCTIKFNTYIHTQINKYINTYIRTYIHLLELLFLFNEWEKVNHAGARFVCKYALGDWFRGLRLADATLGKLYHHCVVVLFRLLFVCMYVCMYVLRRCKYVCMYVRRYEYVYVRKSMKIVYLTYINTFIHTYIYT